MKLTASINVLRPSAFVVRPSTAEALVTQAATHPSYFFVWPTMDVVQFP